MMKAKQLTGGVVVGSIVALGAYDVWVFIEAGEPATISQIILSVAMGNPIVPFCFGVLMGHLFWPQDKTP